MNIGDKVRITKEGEYKDFIGKIIYMENDKIYVDSYNNQTDEQKELITKRLNSLYPIPGADFDYYCGGIEEIELIRDDVLVLTD